MRQILYLLRQFVNLRKEQHAANFRQGYAPTLRRDIKARNIMFLLSEHSSAGIEGQHLLDIGSGNGEISLYLSQAGYNVTSCDVQPPQVELPHFVPLTDAALSFADGSFDVVVYNHVMEHLAQKSDQTLQLREIRRVLKEEGCCYFAQPNRLFPFEYHTGLWFLHWLPYPMWFALAKIFGKYRENVYLRGYFKLKKMIRDAGFTFVEHDYPA